MARIMARLPFTSLGPFKLASPVLTVLSLCRIGYDSRGSIQPQGAMVILPRPKETLDHDPIVPHRIENATTPV